MRFVSAFTSAACMPQMALYVLLLCQLCSRHNVYIVGNVCTDLV